MHTYIFFIGLISLLQVHRCEIIPIDIMNQEEVFKYNKNKSHLVVYYTDWNIHCKSFMENIDKITEKFPELPILTIRCNEDNSTLCNPVNIEYLPHLEFYSKGVVKTNSGALSITSIIEWLKRMHKLPYKKIRTEKDVDNINKWLKVDFAVLIHKGEIKKDRNKFLKRLAFQYDEKIKTYLTTEPVVIEKLGMKDLDDGLYMLRRAKKSIVPINWDTKIAFQKDLVKYRYRRIKELQPDDWATIKNNKERFALILFDKGCGLHEKHTLRQVYTFYKLSDLDYYKLNPKKNAGMYKSIKKELGAPNFCSFMIIQKLNKLLWRKFLYAEYFDIDLIHDVMLKLQDKKLPMYFKSRHTKYLKTNELSHDSLSDALYTLDKGMYVLFYTDESKETDTVKNYMDLIEKSKTNKELRLKHFNIDYNDLSHFLIEEEPVIMYINPKDIYNPIKYNETLDAEKMEEFAKNIETNN